MHANNIIQYNIICITSLPFRGIDHSIHTTDFYSFRFLGMLNDLCNPTLPLAWSIEGITNDGSNALLLVPLSKNKRAFPPYHLLGILDEKDPCIRTLTGFSKSRDQEDKRQEYKETLKLIVIQLDI